MLQKIEKNRQDFTTLQQLCDNSVAYGVYTAFGSGRGFASFRQGGDTNFKKIGSDLQPFERFDRLIVRKAIPLQGGFTT